MPFREGCPASEGAGGLAWPLGAWKTLLPPTTRDTQSAPAQARLFRFVILLPWKCFIGKCWVGWAGRGRRADCVAGWAVALWEGLAPQQGPPCPSHCIPTPTSSPGGPLDRDRLGGTFQRRSRPHMGCLVPTHLPTRPGRAWAAAHLASELSSCSPLLPVPPSPPCAPFSCSGGRGCPWLLTPSPRFNSPPKTRLDSVSVQASAGMAGAVTEGRARGPREAKGRVGAASGFPTWARGAVTPSGTEVARGSRHTGCQHHSH